ncbi:methylenetetrahydrofolate reductase [Thermaerobacter subterraneus]|uniref:5,10-methylenetetrahydrofolate reductase n=1 Tax=Thermaerobacter subterraneus DSM 13965 TaxID=867903 RepID=K6PRE5_9FIRM|nr:methylenetetrahydrofolate reductase [Thermaerobacter subterraneus]EKP95487.1 5,10-methylenetetrahydrofolate reductase [Thermaerobacter subterraneus DSM 13965]
MPFAPDPAPRTLPAVSPGPALPALADGDPSWALAARPVRPSPAGDSPSGGGPAPSQPCPGAPGGPRGTAREEEEPALGTALLPLTEPAAVEGVHLAAIRAGARLVRTATRWASPWWLPSTSPERIEEINLWAAKLARSARELAGRPCLVAGLLGPLPATAAAGGSTEPEAVLEGYRRQVAGLLAGGVDLFWVEARHPLEAGLALKAVREAARLPVGVLLVGEGEPPDALPSPWLEAFHSAGWPDALGVATGGGPARAARWLAAVRRAGWSGPLWVTLGRLDDGPEPVARGLAGPKPATQDTGGWDAWDALRLLGPGWVGGTGPWQPADLEALAGRIQAVHPEPEGPAPALPVLGPLNRTGSGSGPAGPGAGHPDAGHPDAGKQAASLPAAAHWGRSRPAGAGSLPGATTSGAGGATGPGSPAPLREKLGRRFVISVELDPPRGPVATKFLADARTVAAAGADAVNVGDSPMARPRMAAWAGALLARSAGIDAIMHCTTRDRNLMALQADLLAAHALGVRNVLALTGDHPRLGSSGASPVYDVDSIGLLEVLAALRRGEDPRGNALGAPADFTVACALSPSADDLDQELDRFRRKLAVGVVDFVMTQPLYELEPLERVLDRLGGCPVPLVMGVMPLHSGRHAHYLHHQVPGISIPARIREALDRAGERGLEVGLQLAEEVVEAARPYIAGVYVVISYGKAEPVAEFVRRLRAWLDGPLPAAAARGPAARSPEEVRHHAG